MRILVTVVALSALMAMPAQAQMGGGKRHGGADDKKADGPSKKVDDKAYKAALERIPDPKEKYDPWGVTKPADPAKAPKKWFWPFRLVASDTGTARRYQMSRCFACCRFGMDAGFPALIYLPCDASADAGLNIADLARYNPACGSDEHDAAIGCDLERDRVGLAVEWLHQMRADLGRLAAEILQVGPFIAFMAGVPGGLVSFPAAEMVHSGQKNTRSTR